MGLTHSPSIVQDNLLFCLDAANKRSYPGSGSNWYDISGNNRHGTPLSAPTYYSDNGGYLRIVGNSYSMGNADPTGDFHLRQNWSYEVWVYILGNNCGLLGNGIASGNQGLHVLWYTSGTRELIFGMYANDMDSYFGVDPVGKWSHFVFTYNHSSPYTKQLYYNGSLYKSKNGNQYAYTGTDIIQVGGTYSSQGGSGRANGYFSQARLYKKILTPEEVRQNYLATKGRFNL
jgi:hypothetical protein